MSWVRTTPPVAVLCSWSRNRKVNIFSSCHRPVCPEHSVSQTVYYNCLYCVMSIVQCKLQWFYIMYTLKYLFEIYLSIFIFDRGVILRPISLSALLVEDKWNLTVLTVGLFQLLNTEVTVMWVVRTTNKAVSTKVNPVSDKCCSCYERNIYFKYIFIYFCLTQYANYKFQGFFPAFLKMTLHTPIYKYYICHVSSLFLASPVTIVPVCIFNTFLRWGLNILWFLFSKIKPSIAWICMNIYFL